jgi:peroxiredoxin
LKLVGDLGHLRQKDPNGSVYDLEKEKTMIEVGAKAPDFTLESHLGVPFRLSDYLGKRHVMLVFYPLDWTPT